MRTVQQVGDGEQVLHSPRALRPARSNGVQIGRLPVLRVGCQILQRRQDLLQPGSLLVRRKVLYLRVPVPDLRHVAALFLPLLDLLSRYAQQLFDLHIGSLLQGFTERWPRYLPISLSPYLLVPLSPCPPVLPARLHL